MPVLEQIELFLDSTYPIDQHKPFIFKSRSICNYLERALAGEGYVTTLSRINIYCSRDSERGRALPLKGAPFLEVCIEYHLPPIESLSDVSLQGHYREIILRGLQSAQSYMPIPQDQAKRILDQFAAVGFKNHWVHARKAWKKESVRCELHAKLTTDSFLLHQHIYRNGSLIADKLIAQTKPREMLFHEYLGTLSMDRSGCIVYKKKGKVLTKFSLEDNAFSD